MPTDDPCVTVRFEEFESVTEFGTTKTTYRVRIDRVWTPVGRAAAATTRAVNPSPGVIWMRIVEVRVPIGTEVERCIEVPLRAQRANTLDALLGRSSGLKRAFRREQLFVAARGRLSPAKTRR